MDRPNKPRYGQLDRAIFMIQKTGLVYNTFIDDATAQLIAQYCESERWPILTSILIADCRNHGWHFNFANVNRLVYGHGR